MKKVGIKLKIKGETYESNLDEATVENIEQFEEYAQIAAKGSLEYLTFCSGENTLYFPSDVLKKAIIIVVYK